MTNARKTVFDIVNDIVIKGLTKDGLSWFKPWSANGLDVPVNWITGNGYKGINIFVLGASARDKGFEYNEWLPAGEIRRRKLKTEGSYTPLFKFIVSYWYKGKKYTEDQMKASGIDPKEFNTSYGLRYFKMFNIAQIGLEPNHSKVEEQEDNVFEPHQKSDEVVQNYLDSNDGLSLSHGGDRAYYRPSTDAVQMPKPETFVDSDSYYKTLFHELGHSTGAKHRLDRAGVVNVSTVFGDLTYSKEELVAEITAMYCCHNLGLNPKDGNENSQAYITGWCNYLKNCKKECTFAMGQAVHSSNMILGLG
tara:strand:- start:125 stop:1042 length:918 start_codon:yes stop_codon:yes gene_type:complete